MKFCPSPFLSAKETPSSSTRDESPRADASIEALRALEARLSRKSGTVTAGNAPGVKDGAAALVVTSAERAARRLGKKPMARIVGQSRQRYRARAGDDGAGESGTEAGRQDRMESARMSISSNSMKHFPFRPWRSWNSWN